MKYIALLCMALGPATFYVIGTLAAVLAIGFALGAWLV